jgi:HlyD family secretion protein
MTNLSTPAVISQKDNIRILLVDDQNLTRKMLDFFFKSETDFELIGNAKDGKTALAKIPLLKPDLVIIDVDMPEMDGLTATKIISEQFASVKVLVLSGYDDEDYVLKALRVGAKGYFLKSTPLEELAHAIRFINKGYLQLGPGLFEKLQNNQESYYNLHNSTEIQHLGNSPESLVVTNNNSAVVVENNDWSAATKELLDALPRVGVRSLLYTIFVFVAIAIPWSMLAKVDEVGSGKGILEPKNRTIQLDAPVAGTVDAIEVKEGERVKKGQILVKLESEVTRSQLQELEKQRLGHQNELGQLELFKNQLRQELRAQEQQNQTQQQEKVAQLDRAQQAISSSHNDYNSAEIDLVTAQDKVPRYRKAHQEGIMPQDRLLEIEQAAKKSYQNVLQARSKILQAESQYKEQQRSYESTVNSGKIAILKIEQQLKDVQRQIANATTQIDRNDTQIESLNFQLKQRFVKASTDGTIFQLPKGAGAVVQPGQLLAEIAPEKSPLVLRAKIATKDSGFLRVGIPAKIKFDAYPFQEYGILNGRVKWISPNSKVNQSDPGQSETYELEIELSQLHVQSGDKKIALNPGQTATAELIIRQRRVIDYLLEPFQKLRQGGLDL